MKLLPDVFRRSGTQPVEDVVVPLLRALPTDPRLLQQVVRHEAAHDGVLRRKSREKKKTHLWHLSARFIFISCHFVIIINYMVN